MRGGKGLIRAWTTKDSHRHRGVGTDLLVEAVRTVKERCGRDAAVGFVAEHAHQASVLPDLFNQRFRADEHRAAFALEEVVQEWEGKRWRR